MNAALIVASFLSGMLGAMGFGGGTVLIIYLVSFLATEQKEAQGINLVFFIVTGLFGMLGNLRKGLVEKKQLFPFLICAIPGLALGYFILPLIETKLLSKLFGGVLLLLGLKELLTKEQKQIHRR